MIPEIKAQWVAALRSGEYRQGHGHLTVRVEGEQDKDCCLGVLCKLYVKAGLEISVSQDRDRGVVVYDGDTGALPYRVMQWAGLERQIPRVDYDGRDLGVAALNDGANIYDDVGEELIEAKDPLDFLLLADVIEAQL